MNANDIEGCFALSNPIEVIRTVEGDCQANGGELFGGPFEFTTGDGQADMIPEGAITVANSQGENFQWVVTDDEGNILGLPPTFSVVDFDGAGAGTCLVWYARFDGEISGAEVGMNANDIEGCFALSNPIEVIRTEEGDCSAEGGEISTSSETNLCVGDGEADVVNVNLSLANGSNSIYVITDVDLNVIGTQTENAFNFDEAGGGICYIWHLSYEDDVILEGLLNAGDLTGCFALSNSIEVVRNSPEGGIISTNGSSDAITVIVGDGTDDEYTFENGSESSLNYTYITTDGNGVITGTFDGDINFENELAGNCRVYGVSYSGDLTAEIGSNISTVSSDQCFEMSENFVPVIKELFIGIEEQLFGNISIYPTVISNELTITGVEGSFDVLIYNNAGQIVLNQQVTEGTTLITLPNLAKGLYTGRIFSADIIESFRVIKN